MDGLYSIGDVSRLTGLAVSAVRYYADMEIIVPAYTDDRTGYRYFDYDNIKQIETLCFLKQAGFSLSEIGAIFSEESKEGRAVHVKRRREKIVNQITKLSKKLELIDWMSSENELVGTESRAYRISQRFIESRMVLLSESELSCDMEQISVETMESWNRLGIKEDRRVTGYMLDEDAIVGEYKLGITGQLLLCDKKDDFLGDRRYSMYIYMIPNGNYICMRARIFADQRWIKALARYFKEKDLRPRSMLAVQIERDFFNWRESLYEIQVLA